MDCHLTWKLHLDNLVKKLSFICFKLRKLLPTINVKMLWMVYFAHFHSQIGYGIIFWGTYSSVRYVFIIQKRAIRILLRLCPRTKCQKMGPRSSCKEGFKKLDILTVPCLNIFMTWCHFQLKILTFIKLTPLFMVWI